MMDDMVNAVVYFFICGAIDILLTAIVIFTGVGYESNNFYNWINPPWLMIAAMVFVNFVLAIVVMPVIHLFKEYSFYFKTFYYGMGTSRFIIGAGSGIVTLKIAGVI